MTWAYIDWPQMSERSEYKEGLHSWEQGPTDSKDTETCLWGGLKTRDINLVCTTLTASTQTHDGRRFSPDRLRMGPISMGTQKSKRTSPPPFSAQHTQWSAGSGGNLSLRGQASPSTLRLLVSSLELNSWS